MLLERQQYTPNSRARYEKEEKKNRRKWRHRIFAWCTCSFLHTFRLLLFRASAVAKGKQFASYSSSQKQIDIVSQMQRLTERWRWKRRGKRMCFNKRKKVWMNGKRKENEKTDKIRAGEGKTEKSCSNRKLVGTFGWGAMDSPHRWMTTSCRRHGRPADPFFACLFYSFDKWVNGHLSPLLSAVSKWLFINGRRPSLRIFKSTSATVNYQNGHLSFTYTAVWLPFRSPHSPSPKWGMKWET